MGRRAPKRQYPIQMVRPMNDSRAVLATLSCKGKFQDCRSDPNGGPSSITLQDWVVCRYGGRIVLYPPSVDGEPWNGGTEYPDSDTAIAVMRMCANA